MLPLQRALEAVSKPQPLGLSLGSHSQVHRCITCTVCTESCTFSIMKDVCSTLNCWLYSWSRCPSYSRFCFSTCGRQKRA